MAPSSSSSANMKTTTACVTDTRQNRYKRNVDLLNQLGEIEATLIKVSLDEQKTKSEIERLFSEILELKSMDTQLRERNRDLEIHCDKVVERLDQDQKRGKIEAEERTRVRNENMQLSQEIENLKFKNQTLQKELTGIKESFESQTQNLKTMKRCYEEERRISNHLRTAIVTSKGKDATIEKLSRELANSTRKLAEFEQMKQDYAYFRSRVRELELEARSSMKRKRRV